LSPRSPFSFVNSIAFTVSGANSLRGSFNGSPVQADTAHSNPFAGDGVGFIFGRSLVNDNGSQGHVAMLAVFDVYLTDEELVRYSKDPFSLLPRRKPRRTYFPVAEQAAASTTSTLFIKRPWKAQPQQPVAVDQTNSLSRGLIRAGMPTGGSIGQFGRRNSVGFDLSIAESNKLAAQGTLFALLDYGAMSLVAWDAMISLARITTWPSDLDHVIFGVTGSPAQEVSVIRLNTDGLSPNGRTTKTSGVVATAIQFNGGEFPGVGYLFEDGANVLTFTDSAGGPFPTGVARSFSANKAYVYAIWDRYLSAEEHLSLARNPWQLFAPRRIPAPFSPSAASGLPTLSQATYVPGSITTTGFRPRVTAS
jgi:hypothetical protein